MASNLPKHLRTELRLRAWRLACRGRSQDSIAEELSTAAREATGRPLSQPTISRWLAATARKVSARLEDEALASAILSIRQTDTVTEEAFLAWEKSKKPKKKATRKTGPPSAAGSTTEGQTTQEVVEREGDPAWMALVMASIKLRRELLDRIAPPRPPDDDSHQAGEVAAALIATEQRALEYQPDPEEEAIDANAEGAPAPDHR